MKIVKPSVELWCQGDDKVKHVAKCARVCYGRESGNDQILYNNLEKNNHLSMFRHETYYAAVPTKYSIIYNALYGYLYCPYIKYITYKNYCYIITNGNFMRDIIEYNPVLYKYIIKYQISFEEIKQIEPIWNKYLRYTFCVVTQISTSRELNRVSPNNISEQSTRYVYEDGIICKPYWITDEEADSFNNTVDFEMWSNNNFKNTVHYINTCSNCFNEYKNLINLGMNREDARGVLPIDTATKCVYTYSADEWRRIIDLRYYGTTGKPHPNCVIITKLIKEKLEELGYEFRHKL